MNFNEIYENSKKKSIGVSKKEKLIVKLKKITTVALVALIAITSGVSLTACKFSNKNVDLNSAYVYEAEDIFQKYNLSTYEEYTVEQYKSIPDINEDNLIGFHEMLSQKEFEKVVQSLGYESFDDFLIKNGYTDSNGKPSSYKWTSEMAKRIDSGEYRKK